MPASQVYLTPVRGKGHQLYSKSGVTGFRNWSYLLFSLGLLLGTGLLAGPAFAANTASNPQAPDSPLATATATPTARIIGHATWQGRPAQPNALQQLPVTLTLKSATTETNYPVQNTDSSGFFTYTITGLPDGLYTWRVRGPQYLAASGTTNLGGSSVVRV